jgi:uncharacterized protein YbjT (DUF2867 family)
MRGVDIVIAAAHGFGSDDTVSPAAVDRIGNINLIDVAAESSVPVVLMSVVFANSDSPLELFRAKHAAEEHLKGSGTPWTVVRATAFVETWAAITSSPLSRTGRTIVFGRGLNPINFVSVEDVAALVERVLSASTPRGQTIEIGGSGNATFQQFAGMVADALGQPSRPRHVPRAALRAMSVLARPFKPVFARHAGAAVVMDTQDMSFDDTLVRRQFPDLPNTSIPAALDVFFRARERRGAR